MPRVSDFYGIAIYMYYNDHAPPHFHAMHAEDEAVVAIDTLQIWKVDCGAGHLRLSWNGRPCIATS